MNIFLVLLILTIIRSSDDDEALTDDLQSELIMSYEDLELRPRSPTQALNFLVAELEEVGLNPLEKEFTKLISKESSIKTYIKSFYESEDTVYFHKKIELRRSEYPWLEKLHKLLILDRKRDFLSEELYSFLDKNVWLEEFLSLGNINFKDDVLSQNITIESALSSNLPALSTSPNNLKDLQLHNVSKTRNSSGDKPPSQLELQKKIDLMVSDEQQVSDKTSTPSIKNGTEIFSTRRTDPDNSNVKFFLASSTTHPESGESARLSQNVSARLDVTPKLSGQLRHNVFSVKSQPFNIPYQGFGINQSSVEMPKSHNNDVKINFLPQKPQILTDKITDHSGSSITHTLFEKLKINDLQSKPDNTLRLSKTNFRVQGDKPRSANSFKSENETSTYRINGDLVIVKDKQKVKKNKKKSKSKKRHKKKVDTLKETKIKKKSKSKKRHKKKVGAVEKKRQV